MQEKGELTKTPQCGKIAVPVRLGAAEANPEEKNGRQLVHGEDMASKFAMQFFATELLQYLGIRVKVRQIMPTEFVHLEVKHLYEDFNFQAEDGKWYHVEFESDSIGTDDLRRFRTYEAVTSQTYKVPVITYVLCSAGVKRPMSSLKEGINTYRVRVIRLKEKSADTVFRELERKECDEVTKADLVSVVLTPLMKGKISPVERAKQGIRMLSGKYRNVSEEDLKRMQAALFVLADKFLTPDEMKEVKEVCAVNAFLQMYVDDGIQQGVQQGIQQGIQKASDAMLSLVAHMLRSEEDAPKIQFLETDLELRNEMMEKYKIVL